MSTLWLSSRSGVAAAPPRLHRLPLLSGAPSGGDRSLCASACCVLPHGGHQKQAALLLLFFWLGLGLAQAEFLVPATWTTNDFAAREHGHSEGLYIAVFTSVAVGVLWLLY